MGQGAVGTGQAERDGEKAGEDPRISGQVDRRYSTDEVRLKDRTPAMG